MWMDVAQEVEPVDNRSDDEDTVFDRTTTDNRSPFEIEPESKGMLEEIDTRCGFINWRPDWLQGFATKKVFSGVFIIAGILQGTSWAYFTSTISTMEKRFKMSSQTTGSLLAGNELAQIVISIFLSYFGIRSRRMKFISIGVGLLAVSSYMLAFPHLFFGSGKYALSLTKFESDEGYHYNYNPIEDNGDGNNDVDPELINDENGTISASEFIIFPYNHDRLVRTTELCLRNIEFITNSTEKECGYGESGSSFPISILFISQLISGAGTMLFLSSGGPYTEDTIMPNQLPIVFGVTMALRLIGPFFGYVFGSAFLRVFISTVSEPNIGKNDPRWIGAWWLGWIILGSLMTLAAIMFSLFPRQMSREVLKKRSLTTDTGSAMITLPGSALFLGSAELKIANVLPTCYNIPRTFLVIFNNKINIFITLSTLFHMFVGIGYLSFLPKYVEIVFHETSHGAAILSGSVTIAFQAAGLLASGALISNYLPNAERVSLWNVIITSTQIIVLLVITQFGCDHGDVTIAHPLTRSTSTSMTPMSGLINDEFNASDTSTTAHMDIPMAYTFENCSTDCGCQAGPINPLCDENTGRVFYSPCHAGCEKVFDNGTVYADCSCMSENTTLTVGFCEGHGGCFAGYVTFLILTAIIQFLGSTGIVGKMLIFHRSVAPEGRTLVIGLSLLFISFFAILPSPIVFGSLIDSACLIWENTCASRIGNCWLYNNKTLRMAFNSAAVGFLVLGGCFDVLLWRKVKVKDVRLYDGDINPIPKPSSSGNDDDKLRTRVSSSAYS